MLTTTADVMDALGGVGAVARLTDRNYPAAFHWKTINRFPANTFLVIQGALTERGLNAPPSLWGMTEPQPQAAE